MLRSNFEKCFVSYISNSMYYNSINFDKKIRRHNNRYALILDGFNENLLLERGADSCREECFIELENQISDPRLYSAFMRLTERERKILNLIVNCSLTDTEIAQFFNVSQQSISRSKNKALRKLREAIKKGG